ncbi:MAG: molybdenum ABC transporter ATP-binding protein [Isosphaeraceae bacterium]
MSRDLDAPSLDVRVARTVHEGLTIDVSLSLNSSFGIVFGESGAGKSTLLRLIAGLERPDVGFVRLGGTTLFDSESKADLPLRDRRIGMVFQDDLLFPHLGVERNVRFGLKGWHRAAAASRVAEVAALCGVTGLLDRRPETLSGGERQRVGLARALAPRPRLLLCDEPVSALDLPSRNALIDRLREVQRIEAIPVLYVTHSPSEAVALGSTLFLMEAGRVTAQGPPIDVLAKAGRGIAGHLGSVRNTFTATVSGQPADGGSTVLTLDGGPELIVPRSAESTGTRLTVEVLAEEILLASGPVVGLSARNVLAGTVERVLAHDSDAEVIVRTGALTWIVSVVAPAVTSMGLRPGAPAYLVIKARSCRVGPLEIDARTRPID